MILMKKLPVLVVVMALVVPLLAQDKPAQEPPKPETPAPQPPAKIFPDPALEAAVRRYVFAKRENQEPLTEASA